MRLTNRSHQAHQATPLSNWARYPSQADQVPASGLQFPASGACPLEAKRWGGSLSCAPYSVCMYRMYSVPSDADSRSTMEV